MMSRVPVWAQLLRLQICLTQFYNHDKLNVFPVYHYIHILKNHSIAKSLGFRKSIFKRSLLVYAYVVSKKKVIANSVVSYVVSMKTRTTNNCDS